MNISDFVLLAMGLLFLLVGFVPTGGHPSGFIGLITWPIGVILLLFAIVRKVTSASYLTSIFILLALYLLIGLVSLPLKDDFRTTGNLILDVLLWPIFITLSILYS